MHSKKFYNNFSTNRHSINLFNIYNRCLFINRIKRSMGKWYLLNADLCLLADGFMAFCRHRIRRHTTVWTIEIIKLPDCTCAKVYTDPHYQTTRLSWSVTHAIWGLAGIQQKPARRDGSTKSYQSTTTKLLLKSSSLGFKGHHHQEQPGGATKSLISGSQRLFASKV